MAAACSEENTFGLRVFEELRFLSEAVGPSLWNIIVAYLNLQIHLHFVKSLHSTELNNAAERSPLSHISLLSLLSPLSVSSGSV